MDETYERDRFSKEFKTLARQFDIEATRILINEIIDKLTLEQPNSRLMDLLRDFCQGDIDKLESVISAYQAAIDAASKKIIEQTKEYLLEAAKKKKV